MNAVLISVQVSLLHVSNLPTVPPPTTCCRLSGLVWFCPESLPRGLPTASLAGTTASLGLRLSLAGSPRQPAESSSSSCGPAVHLPLLSTPSREDAVTFGYEVQIQPRQGLSPCRFNTLTSALAGPLAAHVILRPQTGQLHDACCWGGSCTATRSRQYNCRPNERSTLRLRCVSRIPLQSPHSAHLLNSGPHLVGRLSHFGATAVASFWAFAYDPPLFSRRDSSRRTNMNSLKNLLILAILGAVGYGVYVSLRGTMPTTVSRRA